MGSLVVACELLVAACMWDLVPWPGIEPGPPALGAQSLTHCATREVPRCFAFQVSRAMKWLKVLKDREVSNLKE